MSRKISVVLGLGSNLGQKSKNLSTAIKFLGDFCDVVKISPVYKTESLLKDDQGAYFNLCVLVKTFLPPLELLANIKNIEKKMGRTNSGKWYSRVLDIDIIDYDGNVISEDTLKIPHPEIENRSFVLYPLMDVYPEYISPVSCRSVSDMVKILKDDLGIKRLGEISWQ